MAGPAVTIGIDIGTSGAKGVAAGGGRRRARPRRRRLPAADPPPRLDRAGAGGLVEGDGRGAARALPPHLADTSSPGSASPARCTARCSSTATASRSARRCCGTMPGPTPNATRSSAGVGRERVIAITGNRASTGHPGAQAAVAAHATSPRPPRRVAKLLLPKDFIRLRLTGEHATDAADASGTLFLDLRRPATTATRSWPPWRCRRTAAAGVRGARGHRPADRRGGGRDRPARRHARGRRRRRQCLRRDRRRPDRGGPRRLLARHLGHPVRAQHDARIDPEGALNAFCDCGAGRLPPDGRHPGRRRRARLVPRPDRRASRPISSPAKGQDPFAALLEQAAACRPARTGCCSCPTSPASARRTWTRMRAAPGSGSASPTTAATGARPDRGRRLRLSPIAWSGCARWASSRQSVTLTGGGARAELWRKILAAQLRVPLDVGTAAEGPALGAAILAQVGSGVAPDLAAGRGRRRAPTSAERPLPTRAGRTLSRTPTPAIGRSIRR